MESTINQQAAGLQVFFNEELGTNIRIKMIGEEYVFTDEFVAYVKQQYKLMEK